MRALEDHEIVAMTQQYTQALDGTYITHIAYEEINRQGATGRQWSKCANCGNPYPLDLADGMATVCSSQCGVEYDEYAFGSWSNPYAEDEEGNW